MGCLGWVIGKMSEKWSSDEREKRELDELGVFLERLGMWVNE